jgi:hypothetical protein
MWTEHLVKMPTNGHHHHYTRTTTTTWVEAQFPHVHLVFVLFLYITYYTLAQHKATSTCPTTAKTGITITSTRPTKHMIASSESVVTNEVSARLDLVYKWQLAFHVEPIYCYYYISLVNKYLFMVSYFCAVIQMWLQTEWKFGQILDQHMQNYAKLCKI